MTGFPNSKRAAVVSALLLPALSFAALNAVSAQQVEGMRGEGDRQVAAFVDVPMPSGIRVEPTELEGPVFADPEGRTLYIWPQKRLRNGYAGEPKGRIGCYDEVRKKTAGLMSPYPSGVLLTDLEKLRSCTDLWKPVLADEHAEPVGKWSVLTGDGGRKQWAYDGQAVYTSVYDRRPGDTFGGTKRRIGGEPGALRQPVGPPLKMPPSFSSKVTTMGLLLTTEKGKSVYSYDGDLTNEVVCEGRCAEDWEPVVAPGLARAEGDWSIVGRAAGVRQWAFRGKPLYTYTLGPDADNMIGSDVRGWQNVFLQKAPPPPSEFTKQDTIAGQVLADSEGRTIYIYNCADDTVDQLSCNHPEDPQEYRLAVCGGRDFDREKCMEHWPYVRVGDDAESTSRAWSVIRIDSETGHYAEPGQEDALRVWAYRGRPVYTYSRDRGPGDVRGDATGEWRGGRNGLKAFWLRHAFFGG